MKNKAAFFAALFIVFVPALFAQNFPEKGNYILQIIGTQDEIPVEILGDVWSLELNGNGIKTSQQVTLDKKNKKLVIPVFTVISDYFIYDVKKDYIDLKAGGNFNIALIDIMRNSMGSLQGINEVTDNFVEQLLVEVEAAFYKVPVMRLYKR
ncbi:MAG: hypothetical protein LBG72_00340 [Spirochaetaceae bacterium]|jgi:hypothetical protein|nr:hypothetical protein [Spirochaetaceae bacterium]